MAIRLGWRNLWRNPRRSGITIGGLAFAFALLIALVGFGRGLSIEVVRNGTELATGHIQVHAARYLPDRELQRTLNDWRELMGRLRRHPKVKSAVARVYGSALVSTGGKSSGAQIVGVEPAEAGLERPGSIVLGDLLALDVGARVGDEVAVVTQAADGTMGNSLFRVRRIVHTGMPGLDRSTALLRIEDAGELLAMEPGRIHEIALRIGNPMEAPEVARELAGMTGAEVKSWRELLPQLSGYVEQIEALNRFLAGMVVLFASLGVLNTMLMATFERVREFGMLNAIGMRPGAIIRTVLAESLLLVSLGLAGGFGLGWILMQYLMARGVNLERWTGQVAMVQTRLDPVVKAAWDWHLIPVAAVSLAAAGIAAAYWPARRATRVDPVEALRAPVMQ